MDTAEVGTSGEELNQEQLVEQVGSKLHDVWREPRRINNTNLFEPRVKTTKDQIWIAAHDGQNQVDIANSDYGELPEEWQAENKASAEAAISEIMTAVESGIPLDDNFIESASAAQHVTWLERNSSWVPEEHKLPYDQLSEAEKQKDRDVVATAVAVFQASQNSQERFPELAGVA